MEVYAAGSTVPIYFTTNSAAGAAVAPSSAFETADVKLYKGGSATERSSQSGWTMTSPFDSITGLHLLLIDLSDDTDAGFYAEGNIYTAVLSPDETVDSQAVAAVIARFQIGPVIANVTQISGDAAAADNLEKYTDGSQNITVNVVQVSNDSTAADTLELFVEALDPSTGKIASVSFLDGAITSSVLAANCITASQLASNALTAAKIAADAIGASQFAADAAAEIATAVMAGVLTIPSAPPTAPYTVDDVLGWLLAIIKFARTQSSTAETVFGDDGTTSIGTAAKSDNGTVFTRAEYAAP